MKYSWRATAAGLTLVVVAERFVDGELAGLVLGAPDEIKITSRASEPRYFTVVGVSSTNAVIGVDAPTGPHGL